MIVYRPKIEFDAPPPPKRGAPYTPEAVRYAFETIPVGCAGIFDRSRSTVEARMYAFLRTPEGHGMRFKVRPISESKTRVWRIK